MRYLRILLIIVLIPRSTICFGQQDSVQIRKLLTDEFFKYVSPEPEDRGINLREHVLFYKMEELYKGYFNGAKVYLIVFLKDYPYYSVETMYYPAIYVVNSSNKIVSFRDTKTFCHFINNTNKPVISLDKCYLFLYLYLKFFYRHPLGLQDYRVYAKDIYTGSLIANEDKNLYFNYTGHIYGAEPSLLNVLYNEKLDSGLLHSTKRNITMYAMYKPLGSPEIQHRYEFSFDKAYKIEDHVVARIDTLR